MADNPYQLTNPNEQNIFDQWVQGVDPAVLQSLINPKKVWGGPVTPAESQEGDMARTARYLREGQQPEQGLVDTSDDLMNLDPSMLTSAVKGIGKYALSHLAEGGLPLVAGMVRMGGKEFGNAYLHRGLSNPAELDFWAKTFQKGRSSQAPTSGVTPSVMSTFGSEPYGLMLNADIDAGQIAHAGAADLWSYSRPGGLADVEARLQRWANMKGDESPEATGKLSKMYNAIRNKLGETGEKEWTPQSKGALIQKYGMDPLVDPKIQGLDELFPAQRSQLQKIMPKSPGFWVNNQLIHNEIIPNIDRSMLSGVRLPLDENVANQNTAIGGTDALVAALKQFAEQQHVPIFRFPAEMTQAQQLKGLEDPFAGRWGTPKGKDYITSSRLPQIFGIGQGDLP